MQEDRDEREDEQHLTRRLFGSMLRRIWALPVCRSADGQWRQETVSGEERAQRGKGVGEL